MAAAQKRVDEYVGAGKVNITYGGHGIRQYYEELYGAYEGRRHCLLYLR